MREKCSVFRLGLVPYRQAWALQDRLANEIALSARPPTLLLLQHPHIYTFGRRGKADHLLWDEGELSRRGVEVEWVDRGGDVTYHGPGQLVGYPLLTLAPEWLSHGTKSNSSTSSAGDLPSADTIGYLRKLEDVLIRTIAHFNISGFRLEGKTGVWVETVNSAQPAKIASIGVKVDARGITRHGFALNVAPDMSYWDGIVACGLTGYSAASLAGLLDSAPTLEEVERVLMESFGGVFNYELVVEDLIT